MKTHLVKFFAVFAGSALCVVAAIFCALKGDWALAVGFMIWSELLVIHHRVVRLEALHTGKEYSAGFIAGVQTCAKEIKDEHSRGRVLSLIGGDVV